MNIKSFSLILILLFFIGGCRTLNAPVTSYETWSPPDWEITSKTTDFVWTSIREEKIDASKPLPLVELIDIALRNNPSTREAWENARAAEAGIGMAESYYYPSATVAGQATRQKKVATIKSTEFDNSVYGPKLNITYLLLDFGGRGADVEQAYQTLLYSNFQFNQSIQDLILSVSQAYYNFYSSGSLLSAAVSDVLDARTSLTAAKEKFNVGLVAKLDVLQARSTYDNSLYTLEEAKGNIQDAKASLAKAIGFPADADFSIEYPKEDLPKEITKRDITKLIEDALRKRPDIAAGRASLRAKEAAVRSANSDLWPKLNLGGQADKNWYDFYNGNTNSANDHEYIGYVSVNWDVFDGFYNLSKKRKAQAERDAEREKLRSAEISASADVWTKYYGYRTAVKKLSFSQAYYDSSKTSYDLAIKGYDSGLKSILDVLQAQSSLSAARSKLIQSKKDLYNAIVDLAHATGTLETKK